MANMSMFDVEKLKQKFLGQNKKYVILAGSIVLIGILTIGGFSFVNSRPKNIINSIDIKYSGYNKLGTAELSGECYKEMEAIIAKKVGYSSSDVEAVKNGNFSVLEADSAKNAQLSKYLSDTEIKLNKYAGLSNGEKVTLSVATSLKDNPIQSSKKTVKVSGLKESKVVTIDELLKKNPIKVTGYNHFGKLDYNDEVYTLSNSDDSSEDNGKDLSNGDTVKLNVLESYVNNLAESGQIVEGSKSTTTKVSGLLDSPKIDNLSDLLSQIDTVERSEHKSNDYNTYNVTRKDSYFIGENIDSWYGSSNEDGFSVVSIYEVSNDPEYGDKTTTYEVVGYTDLVLNNNKVNVSGLKTDDQYSGFSANTEQSVLDDLKSDYPSLVKLN